MDDLTKPILFRPTQANVKVLEEIARRNQQTACTPVDLLRIALQVCADIFKIEQAEGAVTDVQPV